MTRVRLRTAYRVAGGPSGARGEVIEVDDTTAERILARGYASPDTAAAATPGKPPKAPRRAGRNAWGPEVHDTLAGTPGMRTPPASHD